MIFSISGNEYAPGNWRAMRRLRPFISAQGKATSTPTTSPSISATELQSWLNRLPGRRKKCSNARSRRRRSFSPSTASPKPPMLSAISDAAAAASAGRAGRIFQFSDILNTALPPTRSSPPSSASRHPIINRSGGRFLVCFEEVLSSYYS